MTKKVNSITGQNCGMFAAATAGLRKMLRYRRPECLPCTGRRHRHQHVINERSSVEEAYRAPDHSASGVAQALAKGALLAPGVTAASSFLQIFRGMPKIWRIKKRLTAPIWPERSVKLQKPLIKDSATPPRARSHCH